MRKKLCTALLALCALAALPGFGGRIRARRPLGLVLGNPLPQGMSISAIELLRCARGYAAGAVRHTAPHRRSGRHLVRASPPASSTTWARLDACGRQHGDHRRRLLGPALRRRRPDLQVPAVHP